MLKAMLDASLTVERAITGPQWQARQSPSPKSRRIPGNAARSFSRLDASLDLTMSSVAATTITR